MCAGETQRQGVTVEDILTRILKNGIRTNTYVVLLMLLEKNPVNIPLKLAIGRRADESETLFTQK